MKRLPYATLLIQKDKKYVLTNKEIILFEEFENIYDEGVKLFSVYSPAFAFGDKNGYHLIGIYNKGKLEPTKAFKGSPPLYIIYDIPKEEMKHFCNLKQFIRNEKLTILES